MKKFRFINKTWSDEEQRWIEIWTTVETQNKKEAFEKFIRLGKTGEIIDIIEFEHGNPLGIPVKI